MRDTWADEINASCIYIDDPTIHHSKLTIGWGTGIEKHYYLKSISEIIKKICVLKGIENSDVYYYGSSAGGTMSIMLATMHQDSLAIANNPQAYSYKYLKGQAVEKIRLKNFPDLDTNQLLIKYSDRFSITECFKKHNYIPKTLYIFNGYSVTDYDIQYVPFLEELRSAEFNLSNIEFLMYHDKKLKHGPLPKLRTIKLINDTLNS